MVMMEDIIKTRTPFLARYGQLWTKKLLKTFFTDALFLHVPWDLPTFSAERSYFKRLQ